MVSRQNTRCFLVAVFLALPCAAFSAPAATDSLPDPDSVSRCQFPFDTTIGGFYNGGQVYGVCHVSRLGFDLVLGQRGYPTICPLSVQADFSTGNQMPPTLLRRTPQDTSRLFSGIVCCGGSPCTTSFTVTYQEYEYAIPVARSADTIYMRVTQVWGLDSLAVRFDKTPSMAVGQARGRAPLLTPIPGTWGAATAIQLYDLRGRLVAMGRLSGDRVVRLPPAGQGCLVARVAGTGNSQSRSEPIMLP